jgi:hypothetical protein
VGSVSTGGSVAVLTSSSGATWTNTSAGAGLVSTQGFYDVEFCNDRFLVSGWFSKIRHSTKGGATFASTESVTRQIPAFAYGNGIDLAADVTDVDLRVESSTDLAIWTSGGTTLVEDSASQRIVRLTEPVGGASRGFLRVVFEEGD